MPYFCVTDQNRWGYSESRLDKAMRNAEALPQSRAEYYCDAISDAIYNPKDLTKKYLRLVEDDWKYLQDEPSKTEACIIRVVEGWELDRVSGIDGSPSWIQKDDTVDFKEVVISLTIWSNGKMEIRD
jgi:hypothetical protein